MEIVVFIPQHSIITLINYTLTVIHMFMIDIINLAVLLNPNHLEALKVPLWYLFFPSFGDFWKILKTMQRKFLILVSLLLLIVHLVQILYPKIMSNLRGDF